MRKSRIALEEKITAKFMDKGLKRPEFFTQGSSARDMKTIIIKIDGTYDVSAETVQRYIYAAVKDHTDGGAKHKQKCIRVLYKCNYDIDFTAYYEVDGESYSYLAIKGNEWIKDDPSKLIAWLIEKKDPNGQLIRIIKYVKAWASKLNASFKMPSGIALTIWVANNFQSNDERDDQSLLSTLKATKSALGSYVYCRCPVEPYDDLVSKRDDDQKKKFLQALENFCNDAQKAMDAKNQRDASKLWRKHLGDRFPLGADEDVDEKEQALMVAALSVLSKKAKLSVSGTINENSGVSHIIHRNYGE
ncbi:MAG: hypothetical protein ABI550_10180 [Ignavibacteriaceae bacterium]